MTTTQTALIYAAIQNNLVVSVPIQSEPLTFEQQNWLYFRIQRPFPKPYGPFPKTKKEFKFKTFSFAEALASVKDTKT